MSKRAGQLGQAEIQDLHQPLRRDHDVARLQIAMHNAGGMGRGQRVRDLDGVLQGLAHPQPFAPDQLVERFPRHVLHGDVLHRLAIHFLGVDVVDGDDVGVVERGRGLGFLHEALLPVGAGKRVRGQHLEGGRTVQARIYRFINNAHSAGAYLRLDAIGPERCTYHLGTPGPEGNTFYPNLGKCHG